MFYKIILPLLVLTWIGTIFSAEQELSWKDNYEHPDYFVQEEDQAIQNHLDPSLMVGVIIEIHKEVDYANLKDVAFKFKQYLEQKSISVKELIRGSTSQIFYIKKDTPHNLERMFYADFGKIVTWFLLNRQDNSVTIRPILVDNLTKSH